MAEIENTRDGYEKILFNGRTDAEIAEMKTLMENWDQATYPTLANSIVDHANRHDFNNNYLKYWFLRWFYGRALKSQFYRKAQKLKTQSRQ